MGVLQAFNAIIVIQNVPPEVEAPPLHAYPNHPHETDAETVSPFICLLLCQALQESTKLSKIQCLALGTSQSLWPNVSAHNGRKTLPRTY